MPHNNKRYAYLKTTCISAKIALTSFNSVVSNLEVSYTLNTFYVELYFSSDLKFQRWCVVIWQVWENLELVFAAFFTFLSNNSSPFMKQHSRLISIIHWAGLRNPLLCAHHHPWQWSGKGSMRSGVSHQAPVLVDTRISCRKSKQVQKPEEVSSIVGITQMSETLKTQHTCLVSNNISTVSWMSQESVHYWRWR